MSIIRSQDGVTKHLIMTESELAEICEIIEKAPVLAVDTETLDFGWPNIKMTGLGIAWSGTEGAYIPVMNAHVQTLPVEYVVEKVRPILEDRSKLFIAHNWPYDLMVFWLHGIRIPKPKFDLENKTVTRNIFDTLTAAMYENTEQDHGLKALVHRITGYKMTELSDIAPKEKHPTIPKRRVFRTDLVKIEDIASYGCDDVIRLYQIWEKRYRDLVEQGKFRKLFWELDMYDIFVLADMRANGIKIDQGRLQEMADKMQAKIVELEGLIREADRAGVLQNLNSRQQLNVFLFRILGLKPIGAKGKDGYYSVARENLEKLAKKYPDMTVLRYLSEHGQVEHLYSTYAKGYQPFIGDDGRIHADFHRIRSWRLGCSDPNLMNLPRPENDPFGIRGLFVPEDGWVFCKADQSQVELRVLAHLSGDRRMINVYVNDGDLHSETAKGLFGLDCPVEEVKKKYSAERTIGKTFNFAAVYGAGPDTLAESATAALLNIHSDAEPITVEKAKILLEAMKRTYPDMARWKRETERFAERYGYVETPLGHRRHLPAARLAGDSRDNWAKKSHALRVATNHPIQGFAAEIMTISMRNIDRWLDQHGLRDQVRLVLQVHDELVYEVRKEFAEEFLPEMKRMMETGIKLRVPLVADAAIADSLMKD